MNPYHLSSHSERSEESIRLQTYLEKIVKILHPINRDLDDFKIKVGVWITVLLLVSASLQAQTITEIEYYFNNDPGIGNANSISSFTNGGEVIFDGSITTSNLSRGIHTLFIRAKNSEGEWGFPSRRLVLVDEGQVIEIDGFEYFIDDDPGVGSGTFISVTADTTVEITTQIDVSSLERGLYNLFVRARSTTGGWGPAVKQLILVDEGQVIEIDGFEYFFDADPGVGQATQLSVAADTVVDLTTQISTAGLSEGIHNLFIRAKSTTGSWGLPVKQLVLVDKDDPNTISQIVSAEYFFDTDPGFGNATFLELTDATELDETVSINIDSVSAGPHTLYVRVLDEDGEWSMIVNQEIMVTIPPQLKNIEADTLFFTENASAISISDSLQVIAEGGFQIDSAIVLATEGFIYGDKDQLSFNSNLQDSVQFSSNSLGMYKFTGSASAAFYQQILRGIEYLNISEAPDTSLKIVSFQVFGNGDSSEVVSRSIKVLPVDDPPERIAELPVISLPEDIQDTLVITLGDFYSDVDSPISYQITDENDNIELTLQSDSVFISSATDWFGNANVFIEVSSNDFQLLDTLNIVVNPINDAPIAISDIEINDLVEDFQEIIVVNLDSLFDDVDLPNDSLRYSLGSMLPTAINAEIAGSNINLQSVPDSNGVFSFTVIATDDSLASDSLQIEGEIGPVNDAPLLISLLPDTSVSEDADQFSLITLSDYFLDIDSELAFSAQSVNENVLLEVNNATELLVSTTPNWNGVSSLIITADDGEFEVSDTLIVEVRSVNDAPPTRPQILAPNFGEEAFLSMYLIWSISRDTVEFEDPKPLYQLQIDTSNVFNNPVINQTDIGLETILKTKSTIGKMPKLNEVPNPVDSVFAVRMYDLEDSDMLEDDVQYFWRVRSVDSEDSASVWSDTWNFWLNLGNNPPNQVKDGFSPADSITTSSLSPIISWNGATDPDFSDTRANIRYIFQLSLDNQFEEQVYNDSTEIGLNFFKTNDLFDETLYFWRVKAIDDSGVESEWSSIQSFIINQKLDPPAEFELLSPVNKLDTLTANPVLIWATTTDPDLFDRVYYSYQLAEDSLFSNILQEGDVGTDTSVVIEQTLSVGTYYWQVKAVDTDSLLTWASNSDISPFSFQIVEAVSNEFDLETPLEYSLSQNYPNPFNPSTTIQYGIPEATNIRLEVFNLIGQKVATLLNNQPKQAGWHSVKFDASSLSSGVYIYRIQAGDFVQTKQMLLIK